MKQHLFQLERFSKQFLFKTSVQRRFWLSAAKKGAPRALGSVMGFVWAREGLNWLKGLCCITYAA